MSSMSLVVWIRPRPMYIFYVHMSTIETRRRIRIISFDVVTSSLIASSTAVSCLKSFNVRASPINQASTIVSLWKTTTNQKSMFEIHADSIDFSSISDICIEKTISFHYWQALCMTSPQKETTLTNRFDLAIVTTLDRPPTSCPTIERKRTHLPRRSSVRKEASTIQISR